MMQSQSQLKVPFAWRIGIFLLIVPYGVVGLFIASLLGYVVSLPWILAHHEPTGWNSVRLDLGLWLWMLPAYMWFFAPRFGVQFTRGGWATGQAVIGTLLLAIPVIAAIFHGIAWLWHGFWSLPGWLLTAGVWVGVIAVTVYVIVGIARTPKDFRVQARAQRLRAQTTGAHDDSAPVAAENNTPDPNDSEAWGIGPG